MMDNINISNKRVVIAGLTALGLVCLYIIFNYSFLTIHGVGNEEKAVFINKGSESKEITVKNELKRLFLKRGDYVIKVQSSDKQTQYFKTTGSIWQSSTISVELKNQVESIFIGSNELPCAQKTPDKDLIYYSCHPSTPLGLVSARYGSSENISEPSEDDDHDHTLIKDYSATLKPYLGGFIEAKLIDGELTVYGRDSRGALSKNPIRLKNISGPINDHVFSVASSGSFTVLDGTDLYQFDGVKDGSPDKIDMSKDLGKSNLGIFVVRGEKYTYIINSLTADVLDDHSGEQKEDVKVRDAKIFTFDNTKKQIINKFSLPKNWITREASVNQDDELLLLSSGSSGGEVYTFDKDSKLSSSLGVDGSINNACWINSDSFYYLSGSGRVIFRHDLQNQASYLVYGGLKDTSFIQNVNCASGSIYFSVVKQMDNNPQTFDYFTLGRKDFTGTRVESLLPFYHTVGADTFLVTFSKNGPVVRLTYDSQRNGPAPKKLVLREVEKFMKQDGINQTGSLKVDF